MKIENIIVFCLLSLIFFFYIDFFSVKNNVRCSLGLNCVGRAKVSVLQAKSRTGCTLFPAVTRVLEQWASTVVCVCFFFVEIASHILPTHLCKKFRCKSKWRSRLCASLQFQWICVTNQLSWLDTLAQFVGVKWNTKEEDSQEAVELWNSITNPMTNLTATKNLWGCVDSMQMDLFQVPHLFLDQFCWPLPDGYAW